jgi:DNA-binding response OmpR family regulator
MRILTIEDDPGIVRVLERGLAPHGHQVVSADNGDDGIQLALDPSVELVLLDISLPALDGYQVLEQIRARRPTLPVIMLSARDGLHSKVGALNAGADDYVTKPFAFEELLARIRAVSRRHAQPLPTRLQTGDLHVDLLARRVSRSGKTVDLSSREFALLEYLVRHSGQVLSRQQILEAVWEYDFDGESNVVDVYIRYLRRKIDIAGEPSLISTLRGSGYRFDPPAGA